MTGQVSLSLSPLSFCLATEFLPPVGNTRLPSDTANVLATLLRESGQTLGHRPAVTLSVTGAKGSVAWQIESTPQLERRLTRQLMNAYPGSSARPADTKLHKVTDRFMTWVQGLRLTPWMVPVASLHGFIDPSEREFTDPLTTLVTAVQAGRGDRIRVTAQLQLRPARLRLRRRARWLARFTESSHRLRFALVQRTGHERRVSRWLAYFILYFLKPTNEPGHELSKKLHEQLLEARLRFVVSGPTDAKVLVRQKMKELVQSLAPITTGEAEFIPGQIHQSINHPSARSWTGPSFLLTPGEAAMLWHPPTTRMAVSRLQQAEMVELPPPLAFSSKGKIGHDLTIGRIHYRDDQRQIGIDLDARRRHLYLIGKTGQGKSTLLLNIVAEDLALGRGVTLIDPHGDLAESALACVPSKRTNRTIYFDAGDPNHAIAFNPLSVSANSDPVLVADGVLSAFQKVFGLEEGTAPRLLHIFRNCLLTLVGQPGTTILSVQRLLVDERYRETLVHRVKNPVVRQFWEGEYNRWKPADRTAFIASLQNKLGAFTTNERLQRILGQPDSKLDLNQVMNSGHALIVNLSKGRVGENAGNLLGALLVSGLQLAAMSRSSIAENDRVDHSIIIDEFQNFATPAIATFLSESRKMRVHTILSHQYLGQLDDEISGAVIGNVGSMVVFQLGANDAEFFARQLGVQVEPRDLMTIPKYHAYARLHVDGVPSRPFSIATIPPKRLTQRRAEVVRRVTRQRYAKPAVQIDKTIAQQVGN